MGLGIESLAPNKKTLVGGSADLEPSNVTAGFAKLVSDFTKIIFLVEILPMVLESFQWVQ